jgi:hypothetical protein
VNTQLNNQSVSRQNFATRYPQWFRAVNKPVLTGAALLALMPLCGRAEDSCCAPDRSRDNFSFSARVGFNISARFKNPGKLSLASSGRKTPDGLDYNYEDGYVLTDVSGNEGGFTSNWGYDNASQFSGGNILLSKTTSASSFATPWIDMDPAVGGELQYRHEFGEIHKFYGLRYGIEAAGSLINAKANDNRTYTGGVTRRTDAYPFPGVQPPEAPFTGTFNGPNAVLVDTPVSSTFSTAPASLSGNRKIDTDIWGFRLGPYVEMPVAKNFNLSLSGGFAGALLDVGTSWNETLTVGSTKYPFSGSGRDHAWRFGAFVTGQADYQFAEDWSLVGGVQFQSLANYQGNISGRDLEIDLSNSIFVTLGLSYKF